MSTNNWFVITGSPSAGKTTIIESLSALGFKTVPEAARTLIDNAYKKGVLVEELRQNEMKFQEDVAKFKAEVEKSYKSDEIVFFDRGMHDTLAYMRLYGYKIDKWLLDLINNSVYKKVFLLEQLPFYVKDYARTEDKESVEKLSDLLNEVYTNYGMKPHIIKNASVEERLKLILSQI